MLRDLAEALTRRSAYQGSSEELNPTRGDARAAARLAGLGAALLVAPGLRRRLVGGSVAGYALSATSWQQLSGCHPKEHKI